MAAIDLNREHELADRSIVMTRVFDAPRDLVFRAWTDPKHLPNWIGPRGFTNETHEIAIRPGGVWRYTMHGPNGMTFPNKIVWREIEAPKRLSYVHGDDGAAQGAPDFDVTVLFDETAGKTTLTMTITFTTAAQCAATKGFGAVELGQQSMDRLGERVARMGATRALEVTLPSDREIRLVRSFFAPRALVFEVWTNPRHVAHWWGCDGMTVPVCEADVRPGGAWRYVTRMPDGSEHPFRGEYREVVRPERLVQTHIYEPFADHPTLVTTTFAEHGRSTTVTETILHDSRASRDAHLQSNMEHGAAESFVQLADILATLP